MTGLGIALSCAAFWGASLLERRDAHRALEHALERSEARVRERLGMEEQLLRGLAGLVAASEEVTHAEWSRFVLSFNPVRLNPALVLAAYRPETGARAADASMVTYAAPDGASAGAALSTALAARLHSHRSGPNPSLSAPVHGAALGVDDGPLLFMSSAIPGHGDAQVILVISAPRLLLEPAGLVHADPLLRVLDLSADVGTPLAVASRATDDDGPLRERGFDVYGRHWKLQLASPGDGWASYPWSAAVLASGLLLSLLLHRLVHTASSDARRAHGFAEARAAELKLAEDRQRAVLESSWEGILTVDPGGVVKSFNGAAERMFGYRAEDVLGRNVTMLMPERFRARHGALLAGFDNEAVGAVVGLRRDVTGLRRNGEEFPISLAIAAVKGGGPRRFVGVISDISERRRIEDALRESEERFRLMIGAVTDYLIYMIDCEGHVMSWNAGAERTTGYTADEILGKSFECLFADQDHAPGEPQRLLQRALREGQCETEGWGQRKDGSLIWISSIITAVRDREGRLIGFSTVSRDLTERRATEQRLAEAHRLRDAILDAAAFGIIAMDPGGRIRSANPAAERLLFYSGKELLGGMNFVDLVDRGEIRRRALSLSHELDVLVPTGFAVFRAKADRGLVDEEEWTFVRKGGAEVPVQLVMTAMRDQRGEITGYLGIAYDIVERKRREAYVRYIAHHDTLTSLPNRALLLERLDAATKQADREGRRLGVMIVDLDNFKRINDSLGHHVGDELLIAAGRRLAECVRAPDIVARMGGDEFVLLLASSDGDEVLRRIAERVVALLQQPMMVGSYELHVTASVGVARYPSDGTDAATLLKNADAAMYRAKAAGRACYRMFSEEMQQRARDRLELEAALRRALLRHEFHLEYEAQISLDTGRVTGMEALCRWQHEVRGAVSPDEFIPIAEDTGLIQPLGEWVLRTACEEVRRMQVRLGAPLNVAVNLSPRQFAQDRLVRLVQDALAQSGLAPQQLVLEITENSMIAEPVEAVAVLQQLRALGVRIAVDDFGTGYSSLAYVHRFPVDALKIDRSFVRDITVDSGDAAIVRAIIAMAHSLDLKVVAEGVETEAQLAFLKRYGCDGVQGWLLGRGCRAEAFDPEASAWLRASGVLDARTPCAEVSSTSKGE